MNYSRLSFRAQRGISVLARVSTFCRILWLTLREIFDEAAFARYLARTGQTPGRASYAAFLRDTQLARERRPRCC